ncbi:MAG: hemolysin family protein, partial [bacterium]
AGRQEGALEETELRMLHSVFEFDDTIVREIIIPRTDVVALDVDTGYDEVIELARDTGYSRIPVYEGKLDQIVGILNIKDLIVRSDNDSESFNLRDLVRPAYFVPETKNVNQLLGELRRNQVHMAIVVDEYGGTSGIITMEDLLEQIVGEIHDEYDEERDWILKIQDGTYIVDARIDLDDLDEQLGIELPTEEFDSLGGLIVEQMGKIPDEGEKLEYDSMIFHVVAANEQRVKKVRMVVPDEETNFIEETNITTADADQVSNLETT